MRILFLSPNYLGIHQSILDEMRDMGHEVVWIEDKDIPYNFRIPRSMLNKYRCRVMAALKNPHKAYWNSVWQTRKEEMSKPFDVFFCINGRSLCPELFSWLNKMPNLRKCFYCWDSESIFDFYYYQQEFDRLFTFDRVDAAKYQRVEYLPLFWFDKDGSNKPDETKYDISIIGTDHDNRYNIVEKLLPQVKAAGLQFFFKIQIFKPDFSHIALYKWRMLLSKSLQNIVHEAEEQYNSRLQSEIAMTGIISPAEYSKIMDQTACVLDTDRGTQSGMTLRAIWALAKGKKMISTNPHFKEEPFYNPTQICIIDRDNPVLNVDFIKGDNTLKVDPYFEHLRIDNWINHIIGEQNS